MNSNLLNSWLSQAFGTRVKKWPFMRSEMFKKLYISRRKFPHFLAKLSPYMSCYFGLRDGLRGLKLTLFICFSETRRLKWLYVAPQEGDCV